MNFSDTINLDQRHGFKNKDLYAEQKHIIDRWMGLNGYPVLSYQEVENLFGGFGDNRPRKMSDLATRPNAMVTKWFESGQTFYDYYSMPQYVYDNWWCAWNVSYQTYAAAAALVGRKNLRRLVDVGGSVFGASIFAELCQHYWTEYNIHNFTETPNFDFANAYNNMDFESPDFFKDFGTQDNFGSYNIGVFGEYFEHFKNVDEEFEKYLGLEYMVVANAFCVVAYGHHIPLVVNEVLCETRQAADENFVKLAERKGYHVERWPNVKKEVLVLTKIKG
jgi:hypothetical protein